MAITLATIVANQNRLMENQDHLMKKVEDIESHLRRLSTDFQQYENYATQVSDRLIQLTSFISRKTTSSISGSRQGSQDQDNEEGQSGPSAGEGTDAEPAQSHSSDVVEENYEVVDATTVDTAVQEAETAQRIAQGQGRQ